MVLKELCELNGVSGCEKPVRDYIIEKASAHASVSVDRMGNVLAYKKGTKSNKHIMLSAHMDEVGMIITGITDDGLLRYAPVGMIDPRVMVSKHVVVGENKVPGVVGAKAIHLQTREELETVLMHDKLYIDIGATDVRSAEALVEIGDYAAFASEWVEFGEGMVKCKALDDRISCMSLLSLLENDYTCDITCAFTVAEEIGLRGSECAGFNVEADAILALEATTSNDMGDVKPHLRVCEVTKGVAISFMDRSSIADVALFKKLKSLAEENNIPHQLKRFVAGSNDAGALQKARGGTKTTVLSVPCRYIHSPSSAASFSDIEAQFMLADAFLRAGGEF